MTRLKEEELLLRKKLISAGVRDVSGDVELPPNRLDKLDDESADYDDKRLCHSCEFVCVCVLLVCSALRLPSPLPFLVHFLARQTYLLLLGRLL